MNAPLTFERLEDRRLLAVSVTTGKQGLLKIVGDSGDNEVYIDGTGTAGEVEVTVDGSFVGTFSGIKTINVNLKKGDDAFDVNGIHIGGALSVDMGAGDDEFDMDLGDEDSLFIGGSVIVSMGNNLGDVIDWDNTGGGTFIIGNNVTIQGAAEADIDGDGESAGIEEADITIGGFLKITSNVARESENDLDGLTLELDDVNVGGTTIIGLGYGADVVQIGNCNFARRVAISLGGGADTLQNGLEDDPNIFGAEVTANGGGGDDTLEEDPGNAYAVAPVVSGFETVI